MPTSTFCDFFLACKPTDMCKARLRSPSLLLKCQVQSRQNQAWGWCLLIYSLTKHTMPSNNRLIVSLNISMLKFSPNVINLDLISLSNLASNKATRWGPHVTGLVTSKRRATLPLQTQRNGPHQKLNLSNLSATPGSSAITVSGALQKLMEPPTPHYKVGSRAQRDVANICPCHQTWLEPQNQLVSF